MLISRKQMPTITKNITGWAVVENVDCLLSTLGRAGNSEGEEVDGPGVLRKTTSLVERNSKVMFMNVLILSPV